MRTYSVSEFNAEVEHALKNQFFGSVKIEGEVSNFKASENGHWYFTLKDDSSQIQMVMFKGSNSAVKTRPTNGDTVIIIGDVSYYKARGQFQIVCTVLITQGIGAILLKLEELKNKCKREGLFDADKKKTLPKLPSCIGIITSNNAAALEDIKRTFSKSPCTLQIYIFHCSVQGDNAAKEISAQIKNANSNYAHIDALLLSRGGGSLEDLLPFSDEKVIRAISSSQIPIISGVGHEIDTPLCELASDIRAHTPTDAAQVICKQLEETILFIKETKKNFLDSLLQIIEEKKRILQLFHPDNLLKILLGKIQSIQQTIDIYTEQMRTKVRHSYRYTLSEVRGMKEKLIASSPRTILLRGFALIYDENKQSLYTHIDQLHKDARVSITLKDGSKSAIIQ